MAQRFIRRFRVRHYELDVFGYVQPVTFVRYMQEAAIEASTALGCSPDWYREQGALWVVHRLSVRYFGTATYGDEVVIRTWISGMRGVRSTREYELTRASDAAPLARARAEWVYIDMKTGQPTRCPEGWAEALASARPLEDLGVHLSSPQQTPEAHRYTSRRRVQFHELDSAQHVNHAFYLEWVTESAIDALRTAGYPPEQTRQEGWRVVPAGHEIQYFAPALGTENIEITSWVCELGKDCWAWTQEVYNADSRKLLARDYSPVAIINLEQKPSAPSPQIIEAVLRGPTK